MEMEINHKIRAFLEQYIQSNDLQDDDNIFELGYVNSLFAMQLVLFVEEHYGFQVENEDLTLDNFHSVNALTALILRKLAQPA